MLDRLREILRRIAGRPETCNLPLWNADDTSSPFAVPNAVEWLVRAGDSDRAELGHLLAGLMRKVGPHDWTRLYANFRSPWIQCGDIAKLERLPADDAVEMLGVATLSASGYTREAAQGRDPSGMGRVPRRNRQCRRFRACGCVSRSSALTRARRRGHRGRPPRS
jgi:hypothetical protein